MPAAFAQDLVDFALLNSILSARLLGPMGIGQNYHGNYISSGTVQGEQPKQILSNLVHKLLAHHVQGIPYGLGPEMELFCILSFQTQL